MSKPIIDIEDFQKLDIRVGTVINVESVEGADRLYKVKVDLGEKSIIQTITGLVGYYTADELLNKRVIFLTNLKARKLRGEDSEGMLLAAEKDGRLTLITIDRDVPNGSTVS